MGTYLYNVPILYYTTVLLYYSTVCIITYFSLRKSGRFKLLIFLRRSHTRGRFTFPIIYHINNSPVRYIIYLHSYIYTYVSYIMCIHSYTDLYIREQHAMEKGSEVKDYVKNIYSSSFPHPYQRLAGPYTSYCFPIQSIYLHTEYYIYIYILMLIFVAKIARDCNI